jgi:competence ComEA-like helix-hairpin-helix protein
VLGYTRRQLVIVVSLVAGGAVGLAIDHWRHANPDVVAYLETLDRAPATVREPVARRPSARVQDPPHASAPAPSREARGPAPSARDGGRARPARADDATPLDVNLASAAELERLPGVGPALAARIVDVRAREGPFGSVDDLRRVRGVGVATLERLRPRLAVNTP